jgi:hypothetical protein
MSGSKKVRAHGSRLTRGRVGFDPHGGARESTDARSVGLARLLGWFR